MQYFGGKQRIASQLAALMNPVIANRNCYVEPFVGGGSVMASIRAPFRIGADSNASLIQMWKSLSGGWTPPMTVSETDYAKINAARNPSDPMTAFVGFGCSFAGKWFGGYARGEGNRNYAANAASSLRQKMTTLSGIEWKTSDYRALAYPPRSVIYCDPPYQGTTQYGGAPEAFDWTEFWNFCREKSRFGHVVFVSEYAAPLDFICVKEIKTKLDIRTANGVNARTEKLFLNVDYL